MSSPLTRRARRRAERAGPPCSRRRRFGHTRVGGRRVDRLRVGGPAARGAPWPPARPWRQRQAACVAAAPRTRGRGAWLGLLDHTDGALPPPQPPRLVGLTDGPHGDLHVVGSQPVARHSRRRLRPDSSLGMPGGRRLGGSQPTRRLPPGTPLARAPTQSLPGSAAHSRVGDC